MRTGRISIIGAAALILMFCGNCGMMAPSIKKTLFEAHPGFETQAERIHIEHKEAGLKLFSNKYSSTYACTDPESSAPIERKATLDETTGFDLDLTPSISIAGIDIVKDKEYKTRTWRMVISDTGDSNGYEIVGAVNEYKKCVSTDGGTEERKFYAYPCMFGVFYNGNDYGTITIHERRVHKLTVQRRFDLVINERTFTMIDQPWISKEYLSLESGGELLGFLEIKPKNFAVNTRAGDLLLKPDLEPGLRNDVHLSFLIVDILRRTLFRAGGGGAS